MSTWSLFFAWPGGAVWPNLVASAITSCATAVVVVRRGVKKMLDRDRERREAEFAAHRAAVAGQLAEHHAAVMAAVGAPGMQETDKTGVDR